MPHRISVSLLVSILIGFNTAYADSYQNGLIGWDNPSRSEFVIPDVVFNITYPRVAKRTRDVFIDCDLIVKEGERGFATVGFVMQFNTYDEQYLKELGDVGHQQVKRLWQQNYLDYRRGRVVGMLTLMSSTFNLPRDLFLGAGKRCASEFPNHGTDIADISLR